MLAHEQEEANLNIELLASFVGFAFVASITPGPNNFMVMASAGAFGWRRTVPHVLGIAIGFSIMIGISALGLGALLDVAPKLLLLIRACGATWLIWLAWQFAAPTFSKQPPAQSGVQMALTKPFTMVQAMVFQWINPKTWSILIAVTAAFSDLADDHVTQALIMISVFMIVAPASNSAWIFAGEVLRRFLGAGKSSIWFNRVMALLLTMSAIVVLIS